jgi:hypothetical protein
MRTTQIVLAKMLEVTDKVILDDGEPHDVRKVVQAPGRPPTDGQRKLHVYLSDQRLSVKPNHPVRVAYPRT